MLPGVMGAKARRVGRRASGRQDRPVSEVAGSICGVKTVGRRAPVPRTVVDHLVLAVAAMLGLAVTVSVFQPGYMSTDTFVQLGQALGKKPLSDWHPPVMSLFWRGLIAVTGSIASMAVVQQLVFWMSLWLLSTVVLQTTDSLRWGLSTYLLALSPVILTFVGVVWKDVQMAFALLAVTAICVRAPASRRWPWLKWVAFALGVLLLAYATLVRKNAIFAILPLLILLFRSCFGRPTRPQVVLGSAVMVLALVVPSTAISTIARPVQTHQVTQVMLDDLLLVMRPQELSRVDAPAPLRAKLSSAARECAAKGVIIETYWKCYGKGVGGSFTAVAYPDAIVGVWVSEIPRHLAGYVQYRTRLFMDFLFSNRYFFRDGVIKNDFGLALERPMAKNALKSYVIGWQQNLPWLFSGWLWLTLNLVLALRRGPARFRWPVRLLGASGALYILGYFPIVAQTDFRYVYWSVISASVGILLVLVSKHAKEPTPGEPASVTGTHMDKDRNAVMAS